MPQLKDTLKVLVLAALFVALLRAAALLTVLADETQARQQVVSALPAMVSQESAKLRADLRAEIRATRVATLLEARKLASIVDHRLDSLQAAADHRLESMELKADQHLASIDHVAAGATQLMARYEAVPDQMAYANRWLWDCQNFSGCLQSQTLALMGSARATMGAVAKATPEIAKDAGTASSAFAIGFPKIVNNTEAATENFKRLTTRRWYDRLLGVGATAATTTVLGVR